MEYIDHVVIAKWATITMIIFAGLVIQDWMNERRSARTGNPF